jgi:putative flippase GtrA
MLSPRKRLTRFAITGGLAAALQLLLLKLLLDAHVPGLPANVGAFLLAAQFNFLMSSLYTWRDRRGELSLGRRWIAFHGAIAGMAVLNILVFGATRQVLPDMAASAAGIAAGACGNFVLGDRLVFRATALRTALRNDGLRRVPAA